MKRKIELLAPAKNLEYGIEAIRHGADAVYIAGPKFGAREAAGNNLADIGKLSDFAHRYYAKTYMVLNTILYDNELEAARKQIYSAYDAGCDAVIIQDMALLEMDLPPIPLFASTQTDNCTLERVKFLKEVGFQRVILARELSIAEISNIHRECDVELEAFVHGSLCVSYSGRCYISQAITGRSANRGACAQLCRLPYDLYNDQGKCIARQEHLLSLKDLNLSEQLGAMMSAGVSSFKIEGRLKDLAYLKNSTAHYRRLLDSLLEESDQYTAASSGKVVTNFDPDPQRSFSRGFTSYFAQGRTLAMSAGAAKSTGKYIGTVNLCKAKYFTLDKKDAGLVNGDGICFFDTDGQLLGTRVNKVEDRCIYPLSFEGIKVGTKVFKNFDRLFDKQLSMESAVRQIAAKLLIKVDHKQVRLQACDEDGITTVMEFEHFAEQAQNRDLALNSLQTQLTKSGGSIFKFDTVESDSPIAYFFAAAQLNQWRRKLLLDMECKRELLRTEPQYTIVPNDYPYPSNSVDYTANIANKLALQFYRRHGLTQADMAYELQASTKAGLMFNRYCIKFELGLCPRQGAKPTGKLYLVHRDLRFELSFDCKKCEMSIHNVIEP